jgi:uroporphyrinogen decarboxylase
MAKEMSSKERMMRAFRREVPDRVPCCPDISNMIPARLTGKPFWDVYMYENPSLADAYLQAIDYYGIDGWYIYGYIRGGNSKFFCKGSKAKMVWFGGGMVNKEELNSEIVETTPHQVKEKSWVDTPYGRLTMITIYPRYEPPWPIEKMIKDIDEDWPKVRWFLGEDWDYDTEEMIGYSDIGDRGIYALTIDLFTDWWFFLRDGDQQQLIFDLYDREREMKEIFDFYYRYAIAKTKAYIEARPDEIFLQGSCASMSMINPEIYRKWNLPLVREITRMCKEAGIISHQHTCGKSKDIVEMSYRETDLNVMEPLEPPPGGDVILAEAKQKYGDKFCLKGGLNTFIVMYTCTPEEIEKAAKKCIDDAAASGGYVLSTGDQCGRDTPDDNIFKLVEVSKTYGRYY